MNKWTTNRINNVPDVRAFFAYLTEKLSRSWHVDTDFGDYVDCAGKSAFAHKEAETLNAAMGRAIEICTGRGKQSDSFRDVYQIALETMEVSGVMKAKHTIPPTPSKLIVDMAAEIERLKRLNSLASYLHLKAERDELLEAANTFIGYANNPALGEMNRAAVYLLKETVFGDLIRVAIGKARENEER